MLFTTWLSLAFPGIFYGKAVVYKIRGRMSSMEKLNDFVTRVDDFVWGPVMLVLLVGTGVFLI